MPEYYDNTRTSTYGGCNRRYYFRHVRHWTGTGTAIPLVFGLSWHAAMDIVWANINLDTGTLANLALAVFEQTWQEQGLELMENAALEDIERWGYRNPGTAFEMLVCYIEIRRGFIEECEILAVEKSFAVPIDPGNNELFYIGRIDKVVRKAGKVIGIEHKTSSLYKKDGYFRADFIDSFSPNNQVDGYLHALNMMYENVDMILVDAALVHKTVHDGFKFIPVKRAEQHMDGWLWEVNTRIDDMKRDHVRLVDYRKWSEDGQGEHLPMLTAFSKNTNECMGKYGPCTYLDICKMEPNPETINHVPERFKVEKWEPFEVNKISTLGLEDEK